MDLGKSSSELGRALNSIKEWIGQLIEKDSKRDLYICLLLSTDLKLRLPVSFVEKQNKRRVPRFFDEEATDEPVILSVIDIIITVKLERFNFLYPKYLFKMTLDGIHKAAKDFIEIYQFDMCSKSEQPQDY